MPSISSVASTNTIDPAAGVLVPALDTNGTDDPAVVDLGDLATASDLTALDDRVTTLEGAGSGGGMTNPMQQQGDYIVGGASAYVDENASTASPTPVLAMSSGNDLSSSNNRGGGFYYNPTSLPAWVSFDLGVDHTIVGHRMLARNADSLYGASGYKVQYSSDNTNWSDAYTGGSGAGDTGDVPNTTSATARYWRFWQNSNTQWQVNEFYLYSGVPGGVPKRAAGGGTWANRPTSPVLYQMYFHTGIGKPIWWNGTNWVDATATTVSA